MENIYLDCECGKKLRVPLRLMGKNIKCGACGALRVAEAPETEEYTGDGRPAGEADSSGSKHASVLKTWMRGWFNNEMSTIKILITGAAAVLMLILFLVLLRLFVFTNGFNEALGFDVGETASKGIKDTKYAIAFIVVNGGLFCLIWAVIKDINESI